MLEGNTNLLLKNIELTLDSKMWTKVASTSCNANHKLEDNETVIETSCTRKHIIFAVATLQLVFIFIFNALKCDRMLNIITPD